MLITTGIYTGICALFAYFVPSYVLKLQKSDRRATKANGMISGSVFLIFSFLSWVKWKGTPEYFLALFCLLILLMISVTDQWFGIIPNRLSYPSIGVLLVIRWVIQSSPLSGYYVAMLIGGGSLFLLAYLTRGMGIGDAKLFALGGLIVGWPHIWLALWLATISGTSYLFFRFIIKQPIGRKTPFPFGPHLALGIYIAYLYGDALLNHVFFSYGFYPF